MEWRDGGPAVGTEIHIQRDMCGEQGGRAKKLERHDAVIALLTADTATLTCIILL